MPKTLQLSPEIIKLQEDIAVLDKELGKVILERDEMLNTVKPNLESEYQKKIGYRELERMETEIGLNKKSNNYKTKFSEFPVNTLDYKNCFFE